MFTKVFFLKNTSIRLISALQIINQFINTYAKKPPLPFQIPWVLRPHFQRALPDLLHISKCIGFGNRDYCDEGWGYR